MNPASDILIDIASLHAADTWLVLGGGAELAAGIASDHEEAAVFWQAVDLRERNALGEGLPNLSVESPGLANSGVDAVVIAASPDRGLVRRWLLIARDALVEHGRLLVAGANAEGIRSQIADARALFGEPVHEGYRARQRFAEFTSSANPESLPVWAVTPGIAPGTWAEFMLDFDGERIPLVTQAGVFAGAQIDTGTRLLLDALPERVSGRVLDIGCGAGVIGIAAARRGAGTVEMTDVNLLAVQAASENAQRLGLAEVTVFASDVFATVGDTRYDLIASNPPFHRGKAIDYTVADSLIEAAPRHLAPGGSLLIVANAFLAYGKRMERVFGSVETVAANRQYHVIRAADPT